MTHALEGRQIALVDLLDRLLTGGVVISGEITLCVADIDLVRISLRALVASVATVDQDHPDQGHPAPGYRDQGAEEGGLDTVGRGAGAGPSSGESPR